MADIPIHSTVPSLFTQTESASNLLIDNSTKDSYSTNKYNGHVNRLRNVFTEQSLTTDDHSTDLYKTKSMTNNQQGQLTDTYLNKRYSNTDQNYDIPSGAIEKFKKLQRDENDQMRPNIIPSLLPSNAVKRMNHVNTIFVKPTIIEQFSPKLNFQQDNKHEQSKPIESPIFNEIDYVQDDVDKSSSAIYYEKPGLEKLDDEDDDDSLNDTRRVRFSTAAIRVYPTYSPSEYDRTNNDIDPYSASAEYELEKRIEKMDVFNIEIERGPTGLGISVLGMGVGADSGLEKLGIFVKTLNPDGVIAKDGRIQVGDQIIEVNDQSLVGVTHMHATSVLKNTSGLVRFVIGREKDLEKSEILGLIQRSLQLDQEREEMSQTFQKYHDAYYEQNFNNNNNDDDDDHQKEIIQEKLSNEFQIEILKQCYETLEKNLENIEKEKQHYQQLYEKLLNDYNQLEEKYSNLNQKFQDREIQSNEKHEKHIDELMKKIEELEKSIAMKSIAASTDKLSTYSQAEHWNTNIHQQNLTTNNEKLIINKNKLATKHLSTPSLGEISNDSELISPKIHISLVPSLEQTNITEYIEVKNWTMDQCIQWLTAQQMTSFIPIFLNRNIDGEKLLLLDSPKMKAMGIKSSKDRDQLKTKIKELKHAELNCLRERLLNQSSLVHSGKRLRTSSLTRLKERKFFSSSSSGGK